MAKKFSWSEGMVQNTLSISNCAIVLSVLCLFNDPKYTSSTPEYYGRENTIFPRSGCKVTSVCRPDVSLGLELKVAGKLRAQ